MNLSSCSIRLRRSSSRPANAVLNASVMSWIWPMPPPLSSNDDRGQRLLGARVGTARRRQRDQRALVQPALRGDVGGRRQFDVQGTQQAGLAERGRRVRGQLDVAVELHRHQRMPALALDLGDVADVDVTDADARVRLDVVDVGHLRLDRERARPRALGAGQRQRVQPSPARRSRTAAATDTTATAHAAQRLDGASWPTSRRHHHALQAVGRIGRLGAVGRQRRPAAACGRRGVGRAGPARRRACGWTGCGGT